MHNKGLSALKGGARVNSLMNKLKKHKLHHEKPKDLRFLPLTSIRITKIKPLDSGS